MKFIIVIVTRSDERQTLAALRARRLREDWAEMRWCGTVSLDENRFIFSFDRFARPESAR